MSSTLTNITLDCADAAALAGFWSAVLDEPVDEGASPFFATIGMGRLRPQWFFLAVPEGKRAKNRMHVDLTTADREAEITRLLALGATRGADCDDWGQIWTVLTDPEGNEFCLATRTS